MLYNLGRMGSFCLEYDEHLMKTDVKANTDSLFKPGFHMSEKSQMVWDFTVSRPSQILPTNENSKS